MARSTSNNIVRRYTIILLVTLLPAICRGQLLQKGYVDWGQTGTHFSTRYWDWEPGLQMTEDDNFFISRVRPKARFRDPLTQVDPTISEETDRGLCMWMPIGTIPNNGLPDGALDRDVFNLWSYVTHYGDWSASYLRVPGALTDVAHRNGVGVSATATIPYGLLQTDWRTNLQNMVDLGASKMVNYLDYYGIDGFGYNSEFRSSNIKFMNGLLGWHQSVLAGLRKRDPVAEIIWYDGTNSSGACTYDQGLGDHNVGTFGRGGAERSDLFLNYNWNDSTLLARSVSYAESIGRDTRDVYCGFNLQGGEPRSGERWPLFQQFPFSIGLWGAHNENMFFESRGECGDSPMTQQQTYLRRLEMWFSNGPRNPIDKRPLSNSLSYSTDNVDFHGMSALMTARSSLSWDLGTEPFITAFSLGNGTAYYWNGVPTSLHEWYNIGTQDYLPTWRWWWARRLLGRDPEDVPQGLSAQLTWDDAWRGGSCLRIDGSDPGEQYLHLFKTQFSLYSNDRVSVVYKCLSGSARVQLVLTDVQGNIESRDLNVSESQMGEWTKCNFTLIHDFPSMAGKTLRMIALHVEGAEDLELQLGELAILRAQHPAPLAPEVTSATLLHRHSQGCDGKLIWNMPNDCFEDEVCYNLDINTSLFHLYAQVDDEEPVLTSSTTSWAGLYFSVPASKSARQIRFGVSAVGLDMQQESAISWSEWLPLPEYTEEEPDAVTSVQVYDTPHPLYDLQGRRLSSVHSRGLYIRNQRVILR